MLRLSGLINSAAAVVLAGGTRLPQGTSASPGGKMYWTAFAGPVKIQRANLNGSDVEELSPVEGQGGTGLDLTAPAVGGIVELPDVAATPLEASDSSGRDLGFLAGIAALLAAGVVALAGGACYAGRRWTRRRREVQRVRERANRCRFERYPSIRSVPVDRQGPA